MSSSYWPMIWPSRPGRDPEVLAASVEFPVFEGVPSDLADPMPRAIDLPVAKSFETVASPRIERASDVRPDGTRFETWRQGYTETYFRDISTAYGFETSAEHAVRPPDPLSATSRFAHRAVYRRPDGTAEIDSRLSARADREAFILEGELSVRWDDEEIATRTWDVRIPRRYG